MKNFSHTLRSMTVVAGSVVVFASLAGAGISSIARKAPMKRPTPAPAPVETPAVGGLSDDYVSVSIQNAGANPTNGSSARVRIDNVSYDVSMVAHIFCPQCDGFSTADATSIGSVTVTYMVQVSRTDRRPIVRPLNSSLRLAVTDITGARSMLTLTSPATVRGQRVQFWTSDKVTLRYDNARPAFWADVTLGGIRNTATLRNQRGTVSLIGG
jgi:hypothetical protein